jgi:imidazoleglycerol phosphate dehydratase HisB
MPRTAKIHRKTNETDITLRLNLDGRGKARIDTGIRFFDHMLELVARHGAFDLNLNARGDLDVDQHHTVEDVGIALGEAVTKALGDEAWHFACRIFPDADGRDARRQRR